MSHYTSSGEHLKVWQSFAGSCGLSRRELLCKCPRSIWAWEILCIYNCELAVFYYFNYCTCQQITEPVLTMEAVRASGSKERSNCNFNLGQGIILDAKLTTDYLGNSFIPHIYSVLESWSRASSVPDSFFLVFYRYHHHHHHQNCCSYHYYYYPSSYFN